MSLQSLRGLGRAAYKRLDACDDETEKVEWQRGRKKREIDIDDVPFWTTRVYRNFMLSMPEEGVFSPHTGSPQTLT